jgi:putative flavoprotein involved in K+ transport
MVTRRIATAIIGAGQAGLAMSHCLRDRGIEHVVLERGRVAERWRSERWESLRLLTPNWQTRLPGFRYEGSDPDGYMTMPEVIAFFERYARSFSAPLEEHTTVVSAELATRGFTVTTNRDIWRADAIVIASGHSDVPFVPQLAAHLPRRLAQVVPTEYRSPDQLRPGGVLIVGASATGIQLAHEILRTGRRVTLSAGHHTRVPRRYRGKDILWWLDRMGILDATEQEVYDVDISRDQASFQLVGRSDHRSIDLAMLQDEGATVVGRSAAADERRMWFDDDLAATTAAADIKLASLLRRIDRYINDHGLASTVPDAPSFEPLCRRFWSAPTELDIRGAGVETVLWATGYRRQYGWLRIPGLLDTRGEIRQRGGVTSAPGLYVLGLQFMRRRNSSFIDGVGRDASVLAAHLASYLADCHGAVA